MKIGVFSPGRRFGASTVSILIAQMMSIRMGTSVLLTGLDPTDWTHNLYLDLPDTKEITRSLKQVSAMLGVKAISGDEVKQYAVKRGEYFSILNPVVEDLTCTEVADIVEFICNSVENDIVVVDANIELGMEEMDRIIDALDYIIIVVSQSILSKKKHDIWSEKSNSFKEMKEKAYMYVVNEYDCQVSGIREIIKDYGVSKNRVVGIPNNLLVKTLSNESRLYSLIDYFEDDDIRVKGLKNSLEELVEKMSRDMGLTIGG